jgi:bacterioferritin-associated ferredoxin
VIVCSCNAISDNQVSSVFAGARHRLPTVSQVYLSLGRRAQCGRCAPSIKKLRDAVKLVRQTQSDCLTNGRDQPIAAIA